MWFKWSCSTMWSIFIIRSVNTFGFLVMLVTCYDILFQVNIVSKEVQQLTMNITLVIDLLKKCIKVLSGSGMKVTLKLLIMQKFWKTLWALMLSQLIWDRNKQWKNRFQYEAEHQSDETPERQLKFFFNVLIATTVNSLEEQF